MKIICGGKEGEKEYDTKTAKKLQIGTMENFIMMHILFKKFCIKRRAARFF